MDMPTPPGSQRKLEETPLAQAMPSPPTPAVPTPKPVITDKEVEFILTATLRPEHREDPNVIKFIVSYMRCRNASQAAREAGLAPQAGQHLRNRPDIHAAIAGLTQKSVLKFGLDPSEIVERIKEIVEVDPADLHRPDGSFVNSLYDLSPELRRAIKKFKAKNFFDTDANGMKIVKGEIIEVEFYDKMKGAEMLGRETDLFKETTIKKHDVTDKMEGILLGAKARGEQRMNDYRQLPTPPEPVIDVTPVESDDE